MINQFPRLTTMGEFELELRRGDVNLRIRGTSSEVSAGIDQAIDLLEQVSAKLKEKKIEMKVSPLASPEVPHIAPPTPATCRDAILKLLSTEWARSPKTLGELIEVMEINGIYYPKARVATELLSMTRAGIVRRLKTKIGFAYILAKAAP
jgi:hypothetical protein